MLEAVQLVQTLGAIEARDKEDMMMEGIQRKHSKPGLLEFPLFKSPNRGHRRRPFSFREECNRQSRLGNVKYAFLSIDLPKSCHL
jgi:hypothetical protein